MSITRKAERDRSQSNPSFPRAAVRSRLEATERRLLKKNKLMLIKRNMSRRTSQHPDSRGTLCSESIWD